MRLPWALALASAAAAQDISPVAEKPVKLTLDTGYRFLSSPGGDFNTYRSVVNLGDGPKLFGADLRVDGWKNPLFDTLDLSANSWGGEPYTMLRASFGRKGLYRVHGDYRNAAYFNFLPSFANPGLERGSLINQRSFDPRRRMSNVEVEVLPGNWLVPYFAYQRDAGVGTGITPYVANGNEYPAATGLDDGTHHFRGGVRLEFKKAHVTLEQGSSVFHDDQRVFSASRIGGNREGLIFGRPLTLDSIDQRYQVTGGNHYAKAMLAASLTRWAQATAHYIYSRPRTSVTYQDRGTGLFLLGGTRFFNGLESLGSAEARMPRTAGAFAVELRPLNRVRFTQSFWTDRFHNASSALLAERILFAGSTPELRNAFTSERLVVNYNRHQTEGFVDVTRYLTLRAGYRHIWGDATLPSSLLSPASGSIRQPVGLAGFTFRPGNRLSANADYEGSPGDRSYFRTSLHNYHRLRTRVRGQVAKSLTASGTFSFLDNKNPNQGAAYELNTRTTAATLHWLPAEGKRASVLGEYARTSLHSNVFYLIPQLQQRAQSLYRDNAHSVTAIVDLHPSKAERSPAISVGGSFVTAAGTRPVRYYQPLGRATLPFSKAAQCYAEWRWHGMAQPLLPMEGFRTHQFTAGLRLQH